MIIEVQEELLRQANMSEEDFRKEIALLMFEKHIWNARMARAFCGMQRLDFLQLAGSRNIGVGYDVEELMQDWEMIKTSRNAGSK